MFTFGKFLLKCVDGREGTCFFINVFKSRTIIIVSGFKITVDHTLEFLTKKYIQKFNLFILKLFFVSMHTVICYLLIIFMHS